MNKATIVCSALDICGEQINLKGEHYYELAVATKRKSGTEDLVTVIAKAEDVISSSEKLYITGTLNSRISDILESYIVAEKITKIDSDSVDINNIVITGTFCNPVYYKVTKTGKKVSSATLKYKVNERFAYVPIIFFGTTASYSKKYKKGDEVTVHGRLQSRDFFKDGKCHTTKELAVYNIEE